MQISCFVLPEVKGECVPTVDPITDEIIWRKPADWGMFQKQIALSDNGPNITVSFPVSQEGAEHYAKNEQAEQDAPEFTDEQLDAMVDDASKNITKDNIVELSPAHNED